MYGYFFNKPSNQRIWILCNGSCLLFQKRKHIIYSFLKFYVFYCLSQNVIFFLRAMISSPISSIIFCSLPASRSFICRVLYLHFQLFQAFLWIFIHNFSNTFHQYRNNFIFLLNVSFIAVSTAACKSSSLIVLAEQINPNCFFNPAHTPPNRWSASSVIPFYSAEYISTVTTKDYTGQSVLWTINSFLSTTKYICSSANLSLHP